MKRNLLVLCLFCLAILTSKSTFAQTVITQVINDVPSNGCTLRSVAGGQGFVIHGISCAGQSEAFVEKNTSSGFCVVKTASTGFSVSGSCTNYTITKLTASSSRSSLAASSASSLAPLVKVTDVINEQPTNSSCSKRSVAGGQGFTIFGFLCSGFAEAFIEINTASGFCVVKPAATGITVSGSCSNYSIFARAIATIAAPTGFVARVNGTSVVLSWAKPTGATSYQLLRNDLALTTTASGDTLSFTDTTATANIKLTYKIKACSSTSNCSALVSAAPVAIKSEFHSLIVTDVATLTAADFSLQSVLTRLADQLSFANPTDPVTADSLFQRMWDTQNPAPGTSGVKGPKCTSTLNGFQHECRASEGKQVLNPSTFINNYQPIALVNRFDLRDSVTFRDCGEARVVYGLRSNVQTTFNRNFIIFEAQLPNPQPGSAAGCLPIARFWNSLPDASDIAKRANELRNFYFNGIPAQSVTPVIHKDNYAPLTGQIRTNQFLTNPSWVLNEFKITIENGLSIVKPVSVGSNPFGELFRGGNTDARALPFQNNFIANMSTLLTDRDSFFLKVANNSHNNGESHASGSDIAENNFASHFSLGTASFRDAVTQKLAASSVTNISPTQVINRATAMTCGGCHMPSSFNLTLANSIAPGVSWPNSLGFVHISETLNAGQLEFTISPALRAVFLPARKRGFVQYLNSFGISANSALQQKTLEPVATQTITGKRSG